MRIAILVLIYLYVNEGVFANNSDSLLQNANAIILYENYHVSYNSHDKYTLLYNNSTKILNKKAEHLQEIKFHYKEGSQKLSDLEIEVYDADNNLIKKVKSKDIEEYISDDGYSIITDERVKYWSYKSNSYPITINYSYKKESKNTLLLPSWVPIKSYNTAVISSNYILETNMSTRKKELNLTKFNSISNKAYHYAMSNQKPVVKEKYSPPSYEVFPYLIIAPRKFKYEGKDGTYKNWTEYGQWMYNSFLANQEIPNQEKIKEDLAGIILPADDKKTIIRKIYDYVQENTRYISVSLDEGGFRPLSPDKVHQVKYGDCKALSLYTKVLLGVYDIKANYTEVHAKNDNPQDLFNDFACAAPGNHIILNVPLDTDTIWLDCTSHSNPAGFLGTFTDGRSAVSIEEDGGKLIRTKRYSEQDSKKTDKVSLSIEKDGKTTASISTTCTGLKIEDDLHIYHKNHPSQKSHIKDRIYDKLKIREVTNLDLNIEEEKAMTHRRLELDLGYYTELAGEYIFVSKQITELDIPRLPKDKKRINPIYFPRGYTIESSMNIAYTEDINPLTEISSTIETKYGIYASELVKKTDNSYTLNQTFSLYEGLYPATEYNQIKAFFDKLIKEELTPLTFSKS